MNRVSALVDSALRNAWAFGDLPWHLEVDPEREIFPWESFFAAGLKPFRAMSAPQRRSFVFRETCFHLSNLLVGERSGEHLVAQVLVLTAKERPAHREILALMAQEEAKHFLALQRYLTEKAGVLYPPSPQLRSALGAVEACASPEIKVLLGQVVFEWNAASLLATLVTKSREPLVKVLSGRVAPGMEDLVFESVRASVAAHLAEPVWEELGLTRRQMRKHALDRLERLGILHRYRTLVPDQLERCGFPARRLRRRLGQGLVKGLVSDA